MFWTVLILNVNLILAATQADYKTLIEDIFTDGVYNKIVRGEIDLQQTTLVNMSFALRSINRFDEAGETLDIMGMAIIAWKDKRLTWDPAKYNDTREIHVGENMLWTPTIILGNPAESASCCGNDIIVTVDYNGNAIFYQVDVFQVKCTAVVTTFPFDEQSCGILFSVGGYSRKHVDLISNMSTIITDNYLENGVWEIKDTWVNKPNFSFSPMLEFVVTIERKEAFFVVNLLVPPIILGFLSVLVFLIPIESGERISYCITILLTVGIFLNLVSNYLPANSVKMASICYLLLVLFIESTLVCLCSILSVRMYHEEMTAFERWVVISIAKLCKRKVRDCSQDTNFENRDENESPISQSQLETENVNTMKQKPKAFVAIPIEAKPEETAKVWKNYSKNFDCVCFVLFLLQNGIANIMYMSSVSMNNKK